MNKLSNLLSEMTILTEANDDLFDIDKEVDAQIKRVEKRVERKKLETQQPSQEDQQDQELTNSQEDSDMTDEEAIDNNPDDAEDIDTEQSPEEGNEEDVQPNETMDASEDIPEDYTAKQAIPELRILSTLSDSEYALCNIRILEQFKELQDNTESTINNILINITTKNDRQVQIVKIVHDNLLDMLQDISTYILYRNNDIYEENVRTYLTYLKRYDIAMKLIKSILDENAKDKNDSKK